MTGKRTRMKAAFAGGLPLLLAPLLLLTPLLLLCAGCGARETVPENGRVYEEEGTGREEGYGEEEGFGQEEGYGEEDNGGLTPAGEGTIHMCGRSVLRGWFEHWGWDYDPGNPVRFGGHDFVYHQMDVPPGIVGTAREVARQVATGDGGIMFFKLCFADFEGGDEAGARNNLHDNERMVREVVESAVDEEGLTLILGNALPTLREYSDEWLVWNHREYNRFLEGLAGAYGGRVLILDLYGTLAAPEGYLRPAYAAGPHVSHLNDEAYDALDRALEEVLGRIP
mgnify:CR=1 FL=1